MSGKLYLVSTPIGNLGDITMRALETLRNADFIAAEDTRVTRKLLSHFEIKCPLVSYHEHNRRWSGEKIISRILEGENCALVSDAGTPAISDPGEELVRLCAAEGIEILPIPGAVAAIAALTVSGLAAGRFCFEGFLSTARRSRREHLDAIKTETRTMLFYEAPHKLLDTLRDLLEVLGDREVSISRELTKLHEETLRTTLSGALRHFEETAPRGEFVLVVAGCERVERIEDERRYTLEEALELMDRYREEGHRPTEAARLAAAETGYDRRELYARGNRA